MKEIKGEYSRNRATHEAVDKRFVKLAGCVVFKQDSTTRTGLKRIARNKNVFVKEVDNTDGVAIFKNVPYNVHYDVTHDCWVQGDMIAIPEELEVAS